MATKSEVKNLQRELYLTDGALLDIYWLLQDSDSYAPEELVYQIGLVVNDVRFNQGHYPGLAVDKIKFWKSKKKGKKS